MTWMYIKHYILTASAIIVWILGGYLLVQYLTSVFFGAVYMEEISWDRENETYKEYYLMYLHNIGSYLKYLLAVLWTYGLTRLFR